MKADSDNLPVVLLTSHDAAVPALITARARHAGRRFVEFFTANIRSPNTRKAYYRAACEFFDWCDQARLGLLDTSGLGTTSASALTMRFTIPSRRPERRAVS